MQRVKSKFQNPDGTKHGSVQSCIRTNDIDSVGDGIHLTYFEMIGNFSFGGNDYETSVELWHLILKDLEIPVTEVHVHPDKPDHEKLWKNLGYIVIHDDSCLWSDGNIKGYCCELFHNDLEIGNLVNPLGHSTDVGFGLERLVQVIEGKQRVDETSIFEGHPIIADHSRALSVMKENGIKPMGGKGRGYICKTLLRRMLPYLKGESFDFDDWIERERLLQETKVERCRNLWYRHKDKPLSWWKETHGLSPEEVRMLEETE